jgi:hypothetical protein
MPGEPHNGNSKSRLDRLEGLMELVIEDHLKFRDEHKLLLTAQVVLTDRVDRLAVIVREMAEAPKQSDERLNALIAFVDESIRKRPPA